MAATHELDLALDRIDDLFTEPAVDLVRFRFDPQPGMEDLMDELRARRLPPHVRTTISLPDREAEEGALVPQIQTMITSYCKANIKRNELEIKAIRREGL